MIEIPGGTIELRDARTGGTREVTLAAFELGRTAVTRSAYRSEPGGSNESPADAPAHPVTWFEAVRWCNAASVVAGLRPAYAIDGRQVAGKLALERLHGVAAAGQPNRKIALCQRTQLDRDR